MKRFVLAMALAGCAAMLPAAPAYATIETEEARQAAADAAAQARDDMAATFGDAILDNGAFRWKDSAGADEVTRVVVSLSDQLAFAYRDDELIGVSTISSGNETKPTPSGIFPVLEKQRLHTSKKYDNAPMPWMMRLDDYGVAMHAGHLPGYPASHGCVRLPGKFAAKLYGAVKVGTEVLIAS